MKYLLLSAIIYGPGTILYLLAKREQKAKAFTSIELTIFVVVMIAALVAIYSLATGAITI